MTKQQVIDILESYKPSDNIYNGCDSIEEKVDEKICYLIDEIINSVKREADDDSVWIILSDKITMDDLKSRDASIALACFRGSTATWDNPTPDGVDAVDVADVAIKALEKQIPKKLKTEMLKTNIQGYLYMDKCYVCPLCGIFRGNADYQPEKIIKYQFCPDCGQALDWSGEDE